MDKGKAHARTRLETVEYSILRAGLSGEVRYQGKFLVACVEIGPNGIRPIQEGGDDERD